MKSKKIPVDIKAKSTKEAQNEIKEIIAKLENDGVDLENSEEQYNRLIQLNNHIQSQFKKKANEIRHFKPQKIRKNSSKGLK